MRTAESPSTRVVVLACVLGLATAPAGLAQFGQTAADDDRASGFVTPAPGPVLPDALPEPPTTAPRFSFEAASARPLVTPQSFDRILDTPTHVNQGTTTSPGGNCFGVNLTTIDWFKGVALPEIRGGGPAADPASPLGTTSRRLRAFTRTREGGREAARLATQFQDDYDAIQAAYSREEWFAYMQRSPEAERERLWRMYASGPIEPEVEVRDRILRDLRDPDRQLAMVSIWGARAKPPPPVIHPEDAALQARLDALEEERRKLMEELQHQQAARRMEEHRRRWESLRSSAGTTWVTTGGGLPGGFPGLPAGLPSPVTSAPVPFGGRGLPPIIARDVGHSVVVFRADEGTARTPEGGEEAVIRFRFFDPNRTETASNGPDLDARNYLLYFPASARFAIAPTYDEYGRINWHTPTGDRPATFMERGALEHRRVHERIYTVARRIQNARQGDVREVIAPGALDFPRPEGPARDPLPAFRVPILDPGAPPEGSPADPEPRPRRTPPPTRRIFGD